MRTRLRPGSVIPAEVAGGNESRTTPYRRSEGNFEPIDEGLARGEPPPHVFAPLSLVLTSAPPLDMIKALRFRAMRRAFVSLLVLLAGLSPVTVPASFLNLSTRVEIPPPALGEDVTAVIGGFIIGGNAGRKLVIRALGPSLADFGLVGLPDPTLELHDATGALIATNDNWADTQESEIVDTGLAPTNSLESAILITIPPGTYTAIVQGNRGDAGDLLASGTTLVEVYDVSLTVAEGLDNISTRGAVQHTADPMITGFIIGNGDNQTVVLRGLGPSLEEFGLAGLSDPRLDLFDANGSLLATNDNWQDSQATEITATGLAPSDPAEAAILITLPRGGYTAILSAVDGVAHGVALAELYKL